MATNNQRQEFARRVQVLISGTPFRYSEQTMTIQFAPTLFNDPAYPDRADYEVEFGETQLPPTPIKWNKAVPRGAINPSRLLGGRGSAEALGRELGVPGRTVRRWAAGQGYPDRNRRERVYRRFRRINEAQPRNNETTRIDLSTVFTDANARCTVTETDEATGFQHENVLNGFMKIMDRESAIRMIYGAERFREYALSNDIDSGVDFDPYYLEEDFQDDFRASNSLYRICTVSPVNSGRVTHAYMTVALLRGTRL